MGVVAGFAADPCWTVLPVPVDVEIAGPAVTWATFAVVAAGAFFLLFQVFANLFALPGRHIPVPLLSASMKRLPRRRGHRV